MNINSYMSAELVAVSPRDSLQRVIDEVKDKGHEGFPVLEDGTFVGIITVCDVIGADPNTLVEDAMTPVDRAVLADITDDVVSVAGLMAFHRVHHMPIMDEGRLAGMVSSTDVIRAAVENMISEDVQKIFTLFQRLHGRITLWQDRVLVADLRPTQRHIDRGELKRRAEEFDKGLVYPIVVARRDGSLHVVDGHHRAFLALKRGMREIPAFIVEGDELGITEITKKLGITGLEDLKIIDIS